MPVSIDNILWLIASLAEAAIICALVNRCIWRSFPVFLLYVSWGLIEDVGGFVVFRAFRSSYSGWYLTTAIVGSILQLGVLVEIGWSILRPVRVSLSRRALIPVAGVILAIGSVIWTFAALPNLSGAAGGKNLIAQLQQTVSILQIVFFLALIGASQTLSLSWRDRELQIATGFGFSSFISIAAVFMHMHETSWLQYRHLFRVEIGAYICTLIYWLVCFAQQEAERRQFTPEMQRILLSVAGAAHATRVALTEPQTGESRK